jgi:hypothetical protein
VKRNDHWLVRPSTIRRLWWCFGALLALIVLLQFVAPVKGWLGIDAWPGFGAAFGFLSCVGMVLAAKGLGVLLKRPEKYYDD